MADHTLSERRSESEICFIYVLFGEFNQCLLYFK